MKLSRNQGNLLAMLAIVACMASVVRGDLVTFSPVGGSSTVNAGQVLEVDAVLELNSAIEVVQMDVFFDATAGALDFGFGNAPDYGYHADFLAAAAPNNPFPPDFFSRSVENIGGAFGQGGPTGPGPFPVGRFAIDTTGMQPGTYVLMVGDFSFTRPVGELDAALSGSPFPFTVTSSVVPAPGAFLLGAVGLGFVGWFRRRTA